MAELERQIAKGQREQAHPMVTKFRQLAGALAAVESLARELVDSQHPKRCPCRRCKRLREGLEDEVGEDLRTTAGIAGILVTNLKTYGVAGDLA